MLKGKVINIDQIASRSFDNLNFENIQTLSGNQYNLLPSALRRIVKGNPITQAERIIQTSLIIVDSVPPTYASNSNTNFNYGTTFELRSLDRMNKYSVTNVQLNGSGYTLTLPSLLQPLLIYVVKYRKPSDSGTYTINSRSNEKISFGNGSFRSVTFGPNSKAGDYITMANINIAGYNSNWLVIGISPDLNSFDFSYE